MVISQNIDWLIKIVLGGWFWTERFQQFLTLILHIDSTDHFYIFNLKQTTHGRKLQRDEALKVFAPPTTANLSEWSFLFESFFESLWGIWVESSEGILRLYLEPWNSSLFTLFSVLSKNVYFMSKSDKFQSFSYNLKNHSDDVCIPLSYIKWLSIENFILAIWL